MSGKQSAAVAAVVIVLIVAASVAITIRQTPTVKMATVAFFSNNTQGYACFGNYVYPLTGAPVCLSDDPSTHLPDNATVPLGNYTIVFFPFGTASNKSLWLGTNNIHVTASGAYDPSSSYANVTITGDGTLTVFVLPDNTTPVPEFNTIGIVAFSALAASLYILRRRRR